MSPTSTSMYRVDAEFATTMTVVADSPDEAIEVLRQEFPGCALISAQVRDE